jgi:hypothetical protein
MAPDSRDRPAQLLAATVRVLPARHRDWGRAMKAELASITDRPDRRSFARGCVWAAAAEFHLLRGTAHLLAVLATLGTLFAWIAAVDSRPLAVVLYAVIPVLAAVCWTARQAGMFGPAGKGIVAGLLRVAGYLIAAAIAAAALAHAHPATLEAIDEGSGLLMLSTIGAGLLVGLVTVVAKQSAATAQVLITGVGSGLAGTVAWVIVMLVAPPIPTSVGWALVATAVAAILGVLANSRRTDTTAGCLLAGLIAVTTAMFFLFVAVGALAQWGPDWLIPAISPHALPADRVANSRIEIVDPYVLILVLSGAAATVTSAVAVITRRRGGDRRRTPSVPVPL